MTDFEIVHKLKEISWDIEEDNYLKEDDTLDRAKIAEDLRQLASDLTDEVEE